MTYLQNGDILIKKVASIPKEAKKIKTNIVMEGEHTGHAHRLEGGGFTLYVVEDNKYLEVEGRVTIRHEEHLPIEIPPGRYKIDRVREYDHFEEEARAVRD